MSTYVMSDLHGCYDEYLEMLDVISFSEDDMLYILGDVLDRGPHPIKILLDLMKRPNVVCIAGNHEQMGLECLHFLMKEVTEENIDSIDDEMVGKLLNWQENGADTTIAEFYQLDQEARQNVIDFIGEFELYEEVHIGEDVYYLVHAGFSDFTPEKELWEYDLEELVWERPDYEIPYFSDRYVITGHTPTITIEGNDNPGYIYKKNNHIAIDCGAAWNFRLGCICLENGEEFYVECHNE